MEYTLIRIWGDLMLFLFLLAPLLELLAVCVLTLGKLPSQRRKGLLTLFFVMLGLAAALWCGGPRQGWIGTGLC